MNYCAQRCAQCAPGVYMVHVHDQSMFTGCVRYFFALFLTALIAQVFVVRESLLRRRVEDQSHIVDQPMFHHPMTLTNVLHGSSCV